MKNLIKGWNLLKIKNNCIYYLGIQIFQIKYYINVNRL